MRKLYAVMMLCLLAGSFFMGVGIQKVLDNHTIRKEYLSSELRWKNELLDGLGEEEARDLKNQALAEGMQHISMERQMVFDRAGAKSYAGISNSSQSPFGCRVVIFRDATGEVIYRSNLIDPGYYIEEISLERRLRAGYYPCTAVWQFYTKNEEYVGETAWNVVIVVNN